MAWEWVLKRFWRVKEQVQDGRFCADMNHEVWKVSLGWGRRGWIRGFLGLVTLGLDFWIMFGIVVWGGICGLSLGFHFSLSF
ncbi:unnamed protein product [Moneuplotes crassus]|uniref:Transmembrane protein n=1 Tax=Euplotes crassus TaxID=5936 RepID=A0AAD2D713_EUPCR|nr:unnamed protein product [Moneuplotes crassus]